MARRREAPHLIWVKPKVDKVTGKLRSRGYWAIADGEKRLSTGFGLEFRADAEKARHDYEVKLYASRSVSAVINERGKGPRDVLVVDLIRFYLERNAEMIQAKSKEKLRDYLHMVERLIKFWDGKTVFEINENTIREYQATSRAGTPLSDNTVLRDFGSFRPMINFGIEKQRLELGGHLIDWELPAPPPPREAYYTRDEVAALLMAAWKKKNMAFEEVEKNGIVKKQRVVSKTGKGISTSRHIARFILIAVWTGTRSEKIEQASFVETDDRPWMDLDSGIFYRGGVENKSPTNKRADPVRIPDELLAHLHRWRALNKHTDNVIDHKGRAGSTRGAFRRLKLEVLPPGRVEKVNRHTFKHTCASWLMSKRAPVSIIATYLSTTEAVIKKHYGHFHPDFHKEINDVLKIAKAERLAKTVAERKAKKAAEAKKAA